MQKLRTAVSIRNDIVLKNGNSPIFIRLSIGRDSKRFKIPNVEIKICNWDARNQEVSKKEPNFTRKNILISDAKKRAGQIILDYTINNETLTFEIFDREFNLLEGEKISFYEFADELIKVKYAKQSTRKGVQKHINKLKAYKATLTFKEINYEFLMNYNNYMLNTQESSLAYAGKAWAVIKMFINEAIKRGIVKDNPFKTIKIPQVKGKHLILQLPELQTLIKLYQNPESLVDVEPLSRSQRNTLRAFLFSCFTGLRFGDLRDIKYNNITEEGILKIDEEKTGNEVYLPLSDFAKSLIDENPYSKNQKIFNLSINQAENKRLKVVAKIAKINAAVSFHYARRTYSTFIYDATGDLYVASELTGHQGINVTIKHYAQPSIDKKRQALNAMEAMVFDKK